jgi:hypothetical protein
MGVLIVLGIGDGSGGLGEGCLERIWVHRHREGGGVRPGFFGVVGEGKGTGEYTM